MPLKYIPSEVTLQRGEAEQIFAIVLQDEPNESVAQSADTVIENNGIGRLHWTFSLPEDGRACVPCVAARAGVALKGLGFQPRQH